MVVKLKVLPFFVLVRDFLMGFGGRSTEEEASDRFRFPNLAAALNYFMVAALSFG
jgi:hypothetical protein